MSEKHLVAVLVFCLPLSPMFFGFFVGSAIAAPVYRVPGVGFGKVITYGDFLVLWDSDLPDAVVPQNLIDLNNTLNVENTVLNTSDSMLFFESRTTYRNGTEQTVVNQVDVKSGSGSGNLTFVAAELEAGDRVYLSGDFSVTRINSTGLRRYCGLMRETNLLNATQIVAEMRTAFWAEYYWDKATGLLVEQFWSYTELAEDGSLTAASIEYKMIDNNVWVGVSDSVAPVAKAGLDQTVDVGDSAIFDADESRDNIGIASLLWNFGDGESAEGLRVTHVYDTARVFNVTLTVEDGAGNKDLDYLTVTVQEKAFLFSTLILLIIGVVVFAGLILAMWLLLKRRRRRPTRRRR